MQAVTLTFSSSSEQYGVVSKPVLSQHCRSRVVRRRFRFEPWMVWYVWEVKIEKISPFGFPDTENLTRKVFRPFSACLFFFSKRVESWLCPEFLEVKPREGGLHQQNKRKTPGLGEAGAWPAVGPTCATALPRR